MSSFFSRLAAPLKRIPVPARIRTFAAGIVPRSYVLGLAATLVLGGGYMAFGRGGSQAQTSTSLAFASRQTIVSSVKAVGKVTFASEQQLKFNQRGTVAKVNFKQGDRVTKGQVIAELDKVSVLADVRQAQLAANASALQLQQLQADKQKSILDAQNSMTDAERQYQQAQQALMVSQQKLPSDLAAAEQAVQEKETALLQAQNDLKKARVTEMQSLGQTAQSVLTSSEDSLDTLYGILVNDSTARHVNEYQDTNVQIYYRLYSDYSMADQTLRSYNTALKAIGKMRDAYGNQLGTLQDTSKLEAALNDAIAVANAMHTLADSTYQMLQGATSDPHDFTVTHINSLKSSAISARTSSDDLAMKAQTALADLTTVHGSVTSITIQQKEDAVKTAQNNLDQAENDLKVMKTQTPADLAAKQDALAKLQDQVESEKMALNSTTTSTDVNIKLKQNDLSQRATSVQKAAQTLADYELVAPFDGIITHIDYKVGDNLLDTGDTEYLVLQNPDVILVTIPLDQVDVVRVRTGMPASITFDAVPGQSFKGTISTIDPTAIVQSNVISYNVLVQMPAPPELTILSGMTTTVDIETTRKENVLTVPNLALKRDAAGKTTVQKANGQTVDVETGATNGKVTEILSGLQEGDSVVAVNVTTTATASSANAGQIFRLGGGGGGNFGAATRAAGR
ncbi:MAG TPA: efflux RND transporter periplasmic adaptor subunit [Candidatus Peribacteria bacterium]|nr:efflux RND transporter periplasmic adaptor subunit [Candidatus Peribacteria bacterium]